MTTYKDSVEGNYQHVDASKVRNAVNIWADNEANIIRMGGADGSIFAGEGNDSIRYNEYDGDETVYNIGNGDRLELNDCSADDVSISGTDVIITTNYAETITLKNGTGKNIYISGQDWQPYTASNGNEAVPWFAEDDTNFTTTADLDSLLETSIANSVGDISMRGGNSQEAFAPEITYGTDK